MSTTESHGGSSLSQERFWSRRGIGALILEIVLVTIGERLLNPFLDLIGSLMTQQIPTRTTVLFGIVGLVTIVGATIVGVFLCQRIYRWVKVANQAMQTIKIKQEPAQPTSPVHMRSGDVIPLSGEPVRVSVSLDPERTLLLQLGYRCLIRQNLLEMEPQIHELREPKSIYFKFWNDTDAKLKEQLIGDKTIYDILENISRALNDRNNDLDRERRLMLLPSTLHLYRQACDKYYEKLREIGFLS